MTTMFGDCDYCGHSVAYHAPFVGCLKCDCDEFHIRRGAVAVMLVALGLGGCTDDDATIRTARAHGFTHIQTTGWSPFSCSDDDTTSTGFRAKNVAGETVEGTVCCGLVFKNCMLRVE